MKNGIAVSVICNAYNHEKYIRDALEGFVTQKTTFPFEVLVHDDASTDRTAEIIREYEEKYPDIIKPIYQTENQYSQRLGAVDEIQAQRVTGKYIAFCEGDDYWTDPLKLQKQYDFMEQNPEYTLCGTSTQWMNMLTGKVEAKSCTECDRDVDLEEFLFPTNGRPFPTVSFFMKPEIWTQLPQWQFPVGDLPMTYYATMQGKVRMLADITCVYRWYAAGSWTSRNDGNPAMRAKSCENMIRGMENMNRQTDYRYDELIQKKIRQYKYTKALMERDFDAIQGEELIGMYKSRDFVHRLSDRLRCKAPRAYRIVQRIMGKND